MKLVLALLVASLLCGCQGNTSAPADQAAPEPIVAAKAPAEPIETPIALIYKDEKVHVGDKPERAYEKLFGNRAGGFVTERLPQGFNTPYSCRVWQGAEEGFGIISYSGRVVGAMYQESKITRERANEIRQAYYHMMGDKEPTTIAGSKVTYYFWSVPVYNGSDLIGGQRLMVMVLQTSADTVFVTVAMGDDNVMDAIGVNEKKAREEQIDADKMLSKQEANENAAKK